MKHPKNLVRDMIGHNAEYYDTLRTAVQNAKKGKCTLCGKPVKNIPPKGKMNLGGAATCEDCKNNPHMNKYY